MMLASDKLKELRRFMSTSEHTILTLHQFQTLLESDTHIAVYGDVGVTCDTLNRCCFGLIQALGSYIKLTILSAEDVRTGAWQQTARLFVMPGGATTPMRNHLTKIGLDKIRDYVRQGGKYMGLCAGGYWGCEGIEFAKGDPDLERITTDNLGFLKGVGIGPILGTYDYHSTQGLGFTPLHIPWDTNLNQVGYTNGGGWFDFNPNDDTVETLATYATYEDKPAIVEVTYGRGKACLSGVHIEYDSQLFNTEQKQKTGFDAYDDSNRVVLFRHLLTRLLS